jgi:glycosyltransferase involved in cell wall biosynthesis
MNILITAPNLNLSQNVSGVAVVVQNIIQYNNKHRFYHYLLGRPDKPLNKLKWLLQLSYQLLVFPFDLKRKKIDLVHQNLPLDPKGISREYIINVWCRLFRIPVILHVHGGKFITKGTKNLLFRKLAQSLFVNSKHVIVLSQSEQDVLKEKFKFSNSRVLSNSIDTSTFNSKKKKTIGDPPNLLYLGRIEKNKGIVELVEALKLLKSDFNFRFVLCGTGPLVEYCIKECNENLGINFEYKGVVFGDNKINTIKHSDLFILPSYFEGLPISLLETMAAGVIPIVTEVGSMRQIIKNGYNGLFVRSKDPLDLYEILKYILSNKELQQRLSENAIKTITNQFDINKYIEQLNKIYETD